MSIDLAELHLHWGESRHKGKVYRSYSLARAYRKDGKNRKETVLKLGKLSDEAAQRWRTLLKALKRVDAFVTTSEDVVPTDHFAYLDIAAASAVWDEWRLDDAFPSQGKREVPLAHVARILTVNRCIDPVSKSYIPEWFRHTALPWMLDVNTESMNSSRIFRELAVIETHKEAICRHVFRRMSQRHPESMKSVFYDLSSTTFTGSRCVLMKWGHCKEGYRNHVVLMLAVNQEGLPFYWEVLPGGTADVSTMTWVLERLRERFSIHRPTLVFDRGMVSDGNLALLEKEEVKYISAMDRNQLEGITGVDFSKFRELDPDRVDRQASAWKDFTKLNDHTYYREVKVEGKRRYILCFNPQLFKDRRKARERALEEFRSFVQTLNAQLLDAKRSRQRQPTAKKFQRGLTKYKLTAFVQVPLQVTHVQHTDAQGTEQSIRTYRGTIRVDDEEMKSAGKLDGFWLLVTNHAEKEREGFQLSAPDAIAPYQDKVVIEAAFRDIKSFVEIAPVFVWTVAHVRAHYTLCVLSHLINRTLTLRLHEREGERTKSIVSHERLYERLSPCTIDRIQIKNVSLSTCNMTRRTAEQEELLGRIGMGDLVRGDIVAKARASLHT
jgi:transposase